MGVFTSRQRCFEDNRLYIELACGGPKKAGADILPFKYGEGKNLVDPRDALKIAIDVYKAWDLQYWDERKSLKIIDGSKVMIYECDAKGFAAASKWAEKAAAAMDKCGNCQKLIGTTSTPIDSDDIPNRVWCSEMCYSTSYRNMFGIEAPRKEKKAKK